MIFNAIVWDINPEIISSPISLRYYGLLFACAFLAGYYVLQRIFKKDGVPAEWLDSVLMHVIIGTVAGARLGHCLFYDWAYFKDHLLEIFLPVAFEPEFHFTGFQGLASHGAAFGIIIALWLWSRKVSKKSVLWILDRVVITVALGAFFIRMGNLMNSEIIGLPSNLPWAFVFTAVDDIPRHPTQLYEGFSYLSFFLILLISFTKFNWKEKTGATFGLFLILQFGSRIVLEFFKENQVAFEQSMALNMGQILSIPFILAGGFFLWKGLNSKVKVDKN
ncbi:MAG: prolipoprotein diacylglyceryl transferase [Flavobacteriales bacterium]|nr:prolipoprotein diacylglyceryl transferase [Flavobacteriales bacterium]